MSRNKGQSQTEVSNKKGKSSARVINTDFSVKSQIQIAICSPFAWATLLLFCGVLLSLLCESLILSIIFGVLLSLCVCTEIIWGYINKKQLRQIEMFCYYVAKNKPKYSDMVQFFGIDFISRYFDIKDGVTNNSIIEVYLYTSSRLSVDIIKGRKIGKIVMLGDNSELLDVFSGNKG